MKFLVICFALAVCTFGSSKAAPGVGIEGKCPVIPFVEKFDASKFVGKWFGIKQTSPKDIPCVYFQVSNPRPNYFEGFMSPLNGTFELTTIKVDDYAEGLTVSFKTNPFMDGGNLRLFATDYGELK